jgi:hypothetical protein
MYWMMMMNRTRLAWYELMKLSPLKYRKHENNLKIAFARQVMMFNKKWH